MSPTNRVAVFGRCREASVGEWHAIGYVSCAEPVEFDLLSWFGAVQCQEKLITEYACFLHSFFRPFKKKRHIELGVAEQLPLVPEERFENLEGPKHAPTAVPPAAAVESSPNDDMLADVGFVGLLRPNGYNPPLYKQYYDRNHPRTRNIEPDPDRQLF